MGFMLLAWVLARGFVEVYHNVGVRLRVVVSFTVAQLAQCVAGRCQ